MTPEADARSARFVGLIPAAGTGSRVGAAMPKQYLRFGSRSMLEWTVDALLAVPWITRVLVVVAPGDDRAVQALGARERVQVLGEGGATRRDTVLAGLRALRAAGHDERDWVLVHDAARPGIAPALLERLRQALSDSDVGGLLALPVGDTVKQTGADATAVARTLDRDRLWLAQTPQMFRLGLLRAALEAHAEVTDEAAAVERAGHAPRLVEGARSNFKVTTAEDAESMRGLLRARESADERRRTAMDYRIGQGYDVHALVPGRRLRIGGVDIAHARGALGHSDADVLLHAITDALLGAAALGDIGRLFPDDDPQWRGADSAKLLGHVAARVRAAGWAIANVDATVIAQAPKLAAHMPAMVERIAGVLDVPPGQVNVKAKTGERLGFEGRGEGIAAQAVVLLRAAG